MAATALRFSCLALRHISRIPAKRKPKTPNTPIQKFHTTSLRKDDEPSNTHIPRKAASNPFKFDLSTLDSSEREIYDSLDNEKKQQWRDISQEEHEYMNSPEVESNLQGFASNAAYDTSQEIPHYDIKIPRIKSGIFAMGEVEEQDSGEDEEFEGDDITSHAHGDLEQHREMREYARIAAWEMPLLSKLAKPFVPPSLDEPLRFRYTTYMGETHPAVKKIVLEFCTRDLPGLTEPQRIKLVKLAGVRYNPDTDVVKMSSEMFETQAQNKRYLGDLVDTLMTEAKDAGDMFEDVPLDFRHHRFKERVEFPERWKLRAGRRGELEERWKGREGDEEKRRIEGRVISGVRVIEEALKRLPVRDESRVLVEQQRGKGKAQGKGQGKGKKIPYTNKKAMF